jgi:hypothetical protein
MSTRRRMLAAGAGALIIALGAGPAGAAGPFQFHTLTPCRVFDTRNSSGAPIFTDAGSGQARKFDVQGLCSVPVGAKAVTVNVTAVGPTGPGFLTLHPADVAPPLVSSLNFNAGEPALGNGAIVPLADTSVEPQDLGVFARVVPSGTVHVVLDVTGYFQ